MSQQFLNRTNIRTAFQQMSRKAVPQRMRHGVFCDARSIDRDLEKVTEILFSGNCVPSSWRTNSAYLRSHAGNHFLSFSPNSPALTDLVNSRTLMALSLVEIAGYGVSALRLSTSFQIQNFRSCCSPTATPVFYFLSPAGQRGCLQEKSPPDKIHAGGDNAADICFISGRFPDTYNC